MGNLKEVRNRIGSVINTQLITKAMKVVSAAKLRRAQDRIVQMRPYARKLQELLVHLSGSLEGSDAERFYQQRTVRRVLIVVVTSDRGLAGSFNSVSIKETSRLMRERYSNMQADLLTVGKKGRDFFRKYGGNVVRENITIFSDLSYENAEQIAEYAMQAFINGDYDAVDVVYNQFRNAAVYIPTVTRFLPIAEEEIAQGTHKQDEGAVHVEPDYIFEPSREEIVSRLVYQSLKINFFRFLLESNAAEHGARMTAMDKATENADELLRNLRLQYNKERQAAITKEILEIVGGAQALNS